MAIKASKNFKCDGVSKLKGDLLTPDELQLLGKKWLDVLRAKGLIEGQIPKVRKRKTVKDK